jgi:hypothetical protein
MMSSGARKGGKAALGSKDFWSGALFLAVGTFFVVQSRSYRIGTAMQMGPAYFPTVLGALLALIGLVLVVRALVKPGFAVGRLAFGKVGLITLATVLFALLLRRTGLIAALVLLVLTSAYASRRFRWPVALILAAALAAGSSLLFVRLLQLPLPLVGPWLGG